MKYIRRLKTTDLKEFRFKTCALFEEMKEWGY